jgi:uncharacterized protein (DUF433 family)
MRFIHSPGFDPTKSFNDRFLGNAPFCRERLFDVLWTSTPKFVTPQDEVLPSCESSRLERLVGIVADPEHLGGSPRVRGTRISVALILESLAAGMSVAEIVDAYPSLAEESVRGVLTELANQQEPQHR